MYLPKKRRNNKAGRDSKDSRREGAKETKGGRSAAARNSSPLPCLGVKVSRPAGRALIGAPFNTS